MDLPPKWGSPIQVGDVSRKAPNLGGSGGRRGEEATRPFQKPP